MLFTRYVDFPSLLLLLAIHNDTTSSMFPQVKNALGENEQNILTRRVTLLENAQTIKKKMRESQLTRCELVAKFDRKAV